MHTAIQLQVGKVAPTVTAGRTRFESLYKEHASSALRVAFLLVGNRAQAEDIVQEAFIRVLGKFGDLRAPDAFRSYLMRTVVNLSRSHFRRRALELRHQQSVRLEPQTDSTEWIDRNDLVQALMGLPPRQRAAVVLRYCEDLSERQTADLLNTSVKAVKSLVTRGLDTLRERKEELR